MKQMQREHVLLTLKFMPLIILALLFNRKKDEAICFRHLPCSLVQML